MVFSRGVRSFCPKIVQNQGKSVQKLNVRNFNVQNVLQVMFSVSLTSKPLIFKSPQTLTRPQLLLSLAS